MKNQIMKRILAGAILVTLLAVATQSASASFQPHHPVPDAGSTSLLMAVACAGLVALRRMKR